MCTSSFSLTFLLTFHVDLSTLHSPSPECSSTIQIETHKSHLFLLHFTVSQWNSESKFCYKHMKHYMDCKATETIWLQLAFQTILSSSHCLTLNQRQSHFWGCNPKLWNSLIYSFPFILGHSLYVFAFMEVLEWMCDPGIDY